jgi:hypothetical protein
MIPPFDETGYLPPGIHPGTLAEIQRQFGEQSEIRRVQMESVRWMADLARRAGAHRVILNGSFATDIIEPNDVDCLLLFLPGRPRSRAAIRELRRGLPFMDLRLVGPDEFDEYVRVTFGTDRVGVPKGMIEVIE